MFTVSVGAEVRFRFLPSFKLIVHGVLGLSRVNMFYRSYKKIVGFPLDFSVAVVHLSHENVRNLPGNFIKVCLK